MAMTRNPLEVAAQAVQGTASHLGAVTESVRGTDAATAAPEIARLSVWDLADALKRGLEDIGTFRSDVIFLCILYPIVGLAAAALAFDYALLPLLFPAASGFALVGPFAAVGLYELSRRRELGLEAGWSNAFSVFASPSFGAIVTLGIGLLMLFAFWIFLAQTIYTGTLGPEPPLSVMEFVEKVFGSPEGLTLIVVGIGTGAVLALVVLAVSLVSFPMLLDRPVGLRVAVTTSLRVVARNPGVCLAWGGIVTGLLVLGTIPLFLGLIFVLPLLGHATWHVYRAAVRY